jgi:integrase/recombinase XerD
VRGVAAPRAYRLVDASEDHLAWLLAHGYSPATARTRRFVLANLCSYLAELGVTEVAEVSFAALESYQRNQFHHRKADGAPLSFRTQSHRLVVVKLLCSWLVRQGHLGFDPAAGIELPRVERRLPEATLSADEADAVLAGPDVATPLGLRDRAVLEGLYSSALRRSELIGLRVADVDRQRGTVFVRQGKGAKDRYVPIGERAVAWVRRYVDEVRPRLVKYPDSGVLFVSAGGERLCADWLTRTVRAYVKAGAPTKKGSCHLFRHSAATLMLEGGADVRYVAEYLGHENLESTKIYTRVSVEKLRAVHRATHPAGHQLERTVAAGEHPAARPARPKVTSVL